MIQHAIREALQNRGMSAAALARQLGIDNSTLWRILEGKIKLDTTRLEQIAAILEVSVCELYGCHHAYHEEETHAAR